MSLVILFGHSKSLLTHVDDASLVDDALLLITQNKNCICFIMCASDGECSSANLHHSPPLYDGKWDFETRNFIHVVQGKLQLLHPH